MLAAPPPLALVAGAAETGGFLGAPLLAAAEAGSMEPILYWSMSLSASSEWPTSSYSRVASLPERERETMNG